MVWEYKIVLMPRGKHSSVDVEKWEALLNELGMDGWEHYWSGEGGEYFKRCL